MCPDDFHNFTAGGGNVGDICRNEKLHQLNVGWNCPGDCVGIGILGKGGMLRNSKTTYSISLLSPTI